MKQMNWFDRKFEFSVNQNIMPSLIERLEGTSMRLKEKMARINPSYYLIKPEGKWSILEHIGHLADLEPLWQGRLEDILNGLKELRTTDLDNKRTTEAKHNDKPPIDLLNNFQRDKRRYPGETKNFKRRGCVQICTSSQIKNAHAHNRFIYFCCRT